MSNAFEEKLLEVQREFHSVFVPHPGQMPAIQAFFVDWIQGLFLRCGRKLGKTELAIYCCWMFAVLFPNSEVYYVLDEKDHGRKILWENNRLPKFFSTTKRKPGESNESFLSRRKRGRLIESKYLSGDPNNSTMTMRFKNGSFIMVDGAKNYASADGLSPLFIVYDEFKSHDKRFDEAMRPNLDAVDGRILTVGTPPPEGESDHYMATEKEFKLSPNMRHIAMPSYLNEIVYPGGRKGPKFLALEEKYKALGQWHIFAREYLTLIVPDRTAMIFPDLDRKRHVHKFSDMMEEYENSWKDWDHYLVFDPGTTTCFAATLVIINRHDKRFWVMDEVYEEDQKKTTVGQIFPLARGKAEKIYWAFEEWIVGYDSAAAWFANEVAAGYDVGMLPCNKKMRKGEGKFDQLGILKSAMVTGRFAMSDRCEDTYKEMVSYYKQDGGKLPKENDHTIDCLRYTMRFAKYDTIFHPKDKVPTFKRVRIHHSPQNDWDKEFNHA